MVMTAGGQPPSAGAAVAAGTGSSHLEAAYDKEARARVLTSRGAGGRVAASSVLENSQRTPSAESLDAAPLPVFRQSVSSTLTGPGSGSFLMNGYSSCNNSSLEGGAAGPSTKDKGRTGRGAVLGAGGGIAAAARKGEKGKAARDREGRRGEAAREPGRGRAPTSLGSSTGTRSAGAAAGPVGITPYEGAGRAAAETAARGGARSGGIVGDGAAAAGATEKTGGTRAATAGRGGWTALFHGTSGEGRTRGTPERCLLINNADGTTRPAGRPHEGTATAAAVTAIPGGGTGVGRAAAGGAEQQSLLQRKVGKVQKARQWMIAGLVAYFILGLMVLYCVSYANIEWCCIFIIFGVTVGGMGLAGLRHSNRLLLLIHVGAAAVLLFALFVAWCYNIHVLLRAIEILLASSWPPLHHQQFKYYYSIPTAYEAAPAPWLEEVLLMRFRYPSEDDPGIRKLIGAQGNANGSNRRRGKKTASTTGTSNRDGHNTGEKAPTAGATDGGSRKVTDADGGGTNAAEGTEAERQPGNAASADATEQKGRKDAAPATPTAEQKSKTPGRRLESAEEATAAAADQRRQAAVVSASGWRPQMTQKLSRGTELPAMGWRRRLEEIEETIGWRNTWSQLGEGRATGVGKISSTGTSHQEGGMQSMAWGIPAAATPAAGGEERRYRISSGFPLEEVAAAARGGERGRGIVLNKGAPAGGAAPAALAAAETGGGRAGREKETGAGSAAAGEEMRQQARSRGLNRRLQARPAADAAAPRGTAVTRGPRGSPAGRQPGSGTPSPRAIPEEGRARRSGKTEEDENGRTEEAERKRSATLGERASAGAPPGKESAGPYAAARPPRVPRAAASPAAAAAGASLTADAGAAAAGPVSPPAAENASSGGQQLRGSGSVQQQQQEKEEGQEEKGEEQEGESTTEEGGTEAAEDAGPSRGSESRTPSESLSSVLWLAAEQTGPATAQQQMQQRIVIERDPAARGLIKGCVEGAERNMNFLNDAAHAMSSLATRGWLCAFARADILPFHRWPVDCSTECGYGFLDTGHDLQPADYYDMTRVAEYLIQISSLPPKRMQQCVDYAASTICSIKNRNFLAVWVAVLLVWLLLACAACCGILPVSLYRTVQVIKSMQQP